MTINLDPVTILCVRFGTKYGRDYVERLRNMVARHITVPYEFVCLTDDQHPIEGVRSIVQPVAAYKALWWHKVHMFDPHLPIKGSILYFDLDVVISGNIDKLIARKSNQFYGIRDFNRKFHGSWKYLNSSAMSWIHGEQCHIWHEFRKNPMEAMRMHGDQDWIWRTSTDRIKFWPESWIQSYKWEIRSREELVTRDGKNGFKTVSSIYPPADCCVTVFHGDPKPQNIQDPYVIENWK